MRRVLPALLAPMLFACADSSTTQPFDVSAEQRREGVSPSVRGRTFLGVDELNNLVEFQSGNPGVLTRSVVITGLQTGEKIVGIDARPADGLIYGVGTTSRVYTISRRTGVATQSGAPFTPPLMGEAFGVGFNPVADRIRTHSNTEQNLRINPITGAATVDTALAYAASDPNAGANPNIVGTGYTNSFAGATTTELYAIDSNLDILVELPSPNSGKLSTVGSLGVDTRSAVGFDITPDGVAYASFSARGRSTLYTVDLDTGATSFIGVIGNARVLRSIALAP